MASLLEVEKVSHRFGEKQILNEVSFELQKGELFCLLGPSGCGKTTLLRCLAGFEPVAGGQIRILGKVLSSLNTHVPPQDRGVSIVFQDFALFPHLTVSENIEFGLHALTRAERKHRCDQFLELVGLEDYATTRPQFLSGGQQQRVALARALAPMPHLLLMDEPFSNLDKELKDRIKLELYQLLKSTGSTVVLVTHDQEEAFDMGHPIALMNEGRIEQMASTYDLYHEPKTRFTAQFIGKGVLLEAEVKNVNPMEVSCELGNLKGDLPNHCRKIGQKVDILLRPEDIVHDDTSTFEATVMHRAFRGTYHLYTLKLDSGALVYSLAPSHHNHPEGSRIGIRLEVDHLIPFLK